MSLLNYRRVFPLLLLAVAACGDDAENTTPDEDTRGGRGDTGGDDAGNDAGGEEDTGGEEDSTASVDSGDDDTFAPDTGDDGFVSAVCGNGVREAGELCDGNDVPPGASCESQGYLAGTLQCAGTCSGFNIPGGCYNELCGDGIATGEEECEGSDLRDNTCESLGFAPGGEGEVVCAGGCTLDTSACEESICGNGNREVGFEACDGDDFGDDSCRERGFWGGDLTCAGDCGTATDDGCVPNICENGTIEGEEVCDIGAFDATCADFTYEAEVISEGSGEGSGSVEIVELNYAGGVLGCIDSCFEIDLSGCLTAEALAEATDTDEDTVPDDVDNCPDDANPRQLDVDLDGVGNVCDEPVVYNVLAGDEEDNTLATTLLVAGGLGGAPSEFPFSVAVSGAEFAVTFDDDGGLTATMALTLENTEVDVYIEGAAPIPGFPATPTEFTLLIEDATIISDDVDGEIAPDASLEGYLAGDLEGVSGPHASLFTAYLTAADAATEVTDYALTFAATGVQLTRYDDTFAITLNDEAAELAAFQVQLPLIPGIPFGLPTDCALIGLTGTIAATR